MRVPIHPNTLTELESAKTYEQYVQALKALAASLNNWRKTMQRLPTLPLIADEVPAFADCMDFLIHRRAGLRQRIDPSVSQTIGRSLSDALADQADQALIFYERIRGGEGATPQTWTMRGRADDIRNSMTLLLVDLHHLADTSEIPWKQVLQEAQAGYEDMLRESR